MIFNHDFVQKVRLTVRVGDFQRDSFLAKVNLQLSV